MNKALCRNLWIAVSVLIWMAGRVHAQTWVSTPMPNITRIGTEQLNTVAPFSLGVPTQAAPSMRRYRSNSQSSVKGFRIRGYATAIGNPSGTDPHNQLAASFTDSVSFTGTIYGLVVYLPDGLLRFFQCANCNTVNQQWSDTVVYNTPSDYYSYQVSVNSDGSFNVMVVSPWLPYLTIASINVAKASWMPNAYNMSGYLAITANHGVSDGGDWSQSTLHVDQIDVLR